MIIDVVVSLNSNKASCTTNPSQKKREIVIVDAKMGEPLEQCSRRVT
jgi:hypothetical protein